MTATRSGTRNIILCGFMATGKSSVGRRLASLLDYEFLDMDAVIEKEEGMSIPQIFASRGEAAFRSLETNLVERLSFKQRCVVATGGGTIVNPKNLETLKRSGVVITLTADPRVILDRVGSGEDRPMLAGGDKTARIAALLKERDAAYSKADMIVDTSALDIDEVARFILASLEQKPQK
jgi:shikimate kinase